MRDSANNTAQARAKCCDKQQREEQRENHELSAHVTTSL
jgi:hypothetical protein